LATPFSIQKYLANLFTEKEFDFSWLLQEAYLFQRSENPVYRSYCDQLQYNAKPKSPGWVPLFLPIHFFKTREVLTGGAVAKLFFESSGTGAQGRSRHYIADPSVYEDSILKGFEFRFGKHEFRKLLALLPGYLEQPHASLVYMMRLLMQKSGDNNGSFFLHDHAGLYKLLQEQEQEGIPTLLVGVTHALLDFAEKYPIPLKHIRIMETGGMKGRRKEITREEVHAILRKQFGLGEIYSEYGMTELLSQAYALKEGRFVCPPWMKVLIREEDDPLNLKETGRGALNIIDLANIHSCCFIATEDVGEVFEDGSFRVLGRMDQSEWRGCSLMAV